MEISAIFILMYATVDRWSSETGKYFVKKEFSGSKQSTSDSLACFSCSTVNEGLARVEDGRQERLASAEGGNCRRDGLLGQ